MAKSYFNRYVWLLDTIMQHGHITQTDLSDLWQRSALNEDGVPLPSRTFHNHREAILDMFGIDIKFDKTLGYYISNEDMNANGIRNRLMTSLSVNNLINESSTLRDRIILEKIPSSQDYLRAIITAMKAYYRVAKAGFLNPVPVLEQQVAFIKSMLFIILLYGAYLPEQFTVSCKGGFCPYRLALAFALFVLCMCVENCIQNKIYSHIWEADEYLKKI